MDFYITKMQIFASQDINWWTETLILMALIVSKSCNAKCTATSIFELTIPLKAGRASNNSYYNKDKYLIGLQIDQQLFIPPTFIWKFENVSKINS